jgi:thioredoxin 1
MEQFTDCSLPDVIKNNKVVVIDFWAPWCGPCRMLGPIMDKIAEKNPDVIVGKINVDDNPDSAGKYDITGIPAIIIIKDEKIVEHLIGLQPEKRIQESLNFVKTMQNFL